MDKRIVGVVPLWDEHLGSLWMLPGYLDGVAAAGGCPVVLPLTDDTALLRRLADLCDGILFTGGHDVSPALYGQEKSGACGNVIALRDKMEQTLFGLLLARDKPMLGICRGLQMFNVLLGGTLWQDLPTQRPSQVVHSQSPPYDRPAHAVALLKDAPLSALLGTDGIWVNSYHHQAVDALSPRLRAMAQAPDGFVEAAYMPQRRFVWAVQWHPEFAPKDPNSQKLFSAFVDACGD